MRLEVRMRNKSTHKSKPVDFILFVSFNFFQYFYVWVLAKELTVLSKRLNFTLKIVSLIWNEGITILYNHFGKIRSVTQSELIFSRHFFWLNHNSGEDYSGQVARICLYRLIFHWHVTLLEKIFNFYDPQ